MRHGGELEGEDGAGVEVEIPPLQGLKPRKSLDILIFRSKA